MLIKNLTFFFRSLESLIFLFFLGESSDSAVHTVYERIKGIKGHKMT